LRSSISATLADYFASSDFYACSAWKAYASMLHLPTFHWNQIPGLNGFRASMRMRQPIRAQITQLSLCITQLLPRSVSHRHCGSRIHGNYWGLNKLTQAKITHVHDFDCFRILQLLLVIWFFIYCFLLNFFCLPSFYY